MQSHILIYIFVSIHVPINKVATYSVPCDQTQGSPKLIYIVVTWGMIDVIDAHTRTTSKTITEGVSEGPKLIVCNHPV